ncbi:unnamed protein product [Hermetia illucens]|uniref:Uncharacterized protein n=1 Tax=Hermetia illucens TaxID=343691 RepID=A0A7R8UHN5_HERIL|nr:unnamed protein product [Hermetia illucens]
MTSNISDGFEETFTSIEDDSYKSSPGENGNYIGEIRNLRAQLMESYEALTKCRDTLESISFEDIGHKIKNFHLPLQDLQMEVAAERRKSLGSHHAINNVLKYHLEKCEDFGEIPELQIFFRCCSQLRYYVEKIVEQNKQFEQLDQRLQKAICETQRKIANMKRAAAEKILDT